jgi:hypothetical protein
MATVSTLPAHMAHADHHGVRHQGGVAAVGKEFSSASITQPVGAETRLIFFTRASRAGDGTYNGSR